MFFDRLPIIILFLSENREVFIRKIGIKLIKTQAQT